MDYLYKKLLTIIIPCYNAEQYFERCVLSLEGINKDDVSVLFINDGSTDLTQVLIEKWMQKHSNSDLINKQNGGYSSAINTGLDNCNSEYVMFLGVDDELDTEGINNVCRQLKKNKPDILYFSTRKFYDDINNDIIEGEIDPITKYTKAGLYITDVYSLYKELKKDSWILFSRDTSRCFKLEAIGKTRYFGHTGVSADGCFSSIVACQSKSFEFLNDTCYFWHLHKDSVSGRIKTVEKMEEELTVWFEFFTWIVNFYPMKTIPDPIMSHFFAYKKIIDILSNKGRTEMATRHEEYTKQLAKQILKKYNISIKSLVRIKCPSLYKFYCKIKETSKE